MSYTHYRRSDFFKRIFSATDLLALSDRTFSVDSSNAFLGQNSMHIGLPSQRSQVTTVFLLAWNVMAPNSQTLMHQRQPIHADSSMRIPPVASLCLKASLGQAATQGGSSQRRQANATSMNGSILIARIRDVSGLKFLSFVAEQTNSQIPHPVHFS